MKTALLAISLAACTTSSANVLPDASGSGVTPDARSDFSASGTRIKLKYFESSDGAKIVTGLYDRQRDEDCTFALSADGNTRCLPAYRVTTGFFADAACTQPVVVMASCEPAPKYVAALGTITCPSAPPSTGPILHTRGATLTSAYRVNSLNNACVSTGTAPETVYYALGPDVPATEFAMATAKTEP